MFPAIFWALKYSILLIGAIVLLLSEISLLTICIMYCILQLGNTQEQGVRVMKTLTDTTINPLSLRMTEESYEVIENESIVNSNFKSLTISGSLFSLTTFKNVTFDSCVFFATRMENCEFIKCNFINCQFQFSNITHCDLHFAKFDHCTWSFSTLKHNIIVECWLDCQIRHALTKVTSNRIVNSFDVDGWSLEHSSKFSKIA